MDPAEAGISRDALPGEPLAMWYLGNFDTTVAPAWPFRLADDLGLEVGATLQVWSTSNEDKTWIQTGTATVTSEGKIESDVGGGITKLTTLAFIAD
jgi:hypothetical protein